MFNWNEITPSVDIAVALSIIGATLTFILTTLADHRRDKQHRSWDAFSSYTHTALATVLIRRDEYIKFYSAYERALNDRVPGSTKGINSLIAHSAETLLFVQIGLLQAFTEYKATDSDVQKRAAVYAKISKEFCNDLFKWNKDVYTFHTLDAGDIEGQNSIKKKYLVSGDFNGFITHPALLMTKLYRTLVEKGEYIR